MNAFSHFVLDTLLSHNGVQDAQSSFVLKEIEEDNNKWKDILLTIQLDGITYETVGEKKLTSEQLLSKMLPYCSHLLIKFSVS